MGYFLQDDVAVPGRTPEPHTRFWRLSGGGLRYYIPPVGRWASRDPIGERGGGNLYRCVRNRPPDLIDPLGLWEIGSNWPTQCGKCSVKYEKVDLLGNGGDVAFGGYSWGTPSVTTCGGGTGPTDPSKFSVAYPNTKCSATVRFDPDTDPDAIIPGVGISYLIHEQKHVQCKADAYDWALKRFGALASRCCCNTELLFSLAELIKIAASWNDTACSEGVDCQDYAKSTNADLKKSAPGECASSAQHTTLFLQKEQQIDKALKDLETCQEK